MYFEDYEELVRAAAKDDEQTELDWNSIAVNEEYQVLSEFFSSDNFFDSWEEVDRLPEETERPCPPG